MDFQDFLRIRSTLFENKIVEEEIFYGLINAKEAKKIELYYDPFSRNETLHNIIDYELKKEGKDFLSLKSIMKIIENIGCESIVSETTMTDRFMVFIKKIGIKSNYTLHGEKHFKFVKMQIPIVIFILIELGTSKTLLNMYTTQSVDRITYKDLDNFFTQLYNFLYVYGEDKDLNTQIFNSFMSHFKFDMLLSYQIKLKRLDNLYEIINGYEKIETPDLNRRIEMTFNLDKTLNGVYDKLENIYKKDIKNNENINEKSEHVKFSFLQSIGH